MNIDRFKKIVEYCQTNSQDIEYKIRNFYSAMNIYSDTGVRDVLLSVREAFLRRGFIFFEMPFADDEIGALCYKGDGLGYVVINSSIPKVNSNFAVAHEIYHVFFQESKFESKIEFANDHYYEREDEFSANAFAGYLLMPENGFREMFEKFKSESKEIFDVICKLMNYYQTPYMATLIRCCELRLIEMKDMSGELMFAGKDCIADKFSELWLDVKILEPSHRDDLANVEGLVKQVGKGFVAEEYINQRTLDMVLANMDTLGRQIKGDEA